MKLDAPSLKALQRPEAPRPVAACLQRRGAFSDMQRDSVPLQRRTTAIRTTGSGKQNMPSQGTQPERRIIVVDDDASMRELIGLHLFNAGYAVALAEDAIQAGYMVLASPPDLLILNTELPFLSGLDFVATLLADSTLPAVPVIFISAQETHADQAQLLDADLLRKPIFKDLLLAAVGRKISEAARNDQPGVVDASSNAAQRPSKSFAGIKREPQLRSETAS
jgi:CheY-like chemotaxis protein